MILNISALLVHETQIGARTRSMAGEMRMQVRKFLTLSNFYSILWADYTAGRQESFPVLDSSESN